MKPFSLIFLVGLYVTGSTSVPAQKAKAPVVVKPPQLTRTTTRHESQRFGFGGTFTLVGAPEGSISVEGWSRNEIDITANIELRADTEADLDLLALVNTFVIDEDMNHLRVLTTGTHDKAFMRSAAKKFPKTLLGLPWKVDYRVRVPMATDLDISGGRGPVSLSGVEGNIRLSATESDAKLKLSGGTLSVTIAGGKLNLEIPSRSWRGVGGEVRLAVGEITIELPGGFNGDLNAEILRTGKVVDAYGGLEAREKPGITPRNVKARIGSGGAAFQLTVGDGTIYIKRQ